MLYGQCRIMGKCICALCEAASNPYIPSWHRRELKRKRAGFYNGRYYPNGIAPRTTTCKTCGGKMGGHLPNCNPMAMILLGIKKVPMSVPIKLPPYCEWCGRARHTGRRCQGALDESREAHTMTA